jgi:hypothetical protein
MTPPFPAGFGPESLAAYADGELDPTARAAVERWLAEHPEALEELRTQQEFSPENAQLWQQVEPPPVPEGTWVEIRNQVAEATMPAPVIRISARRVAAWLIGGVAAAASAAAIVWILLPPAPAPSPHAPVEPEQVARAAEPADPLAEFAVLPVATEDDVELQRVAENADKGLPIGVAPLSGPMVLAVGGDVELEGADAHPAWGGGGPKITTNPVEAAMIFAAPHR